MARHLIQSATTGETHIVGDAALPFFPGYVIKDTLEDGQPPAVYYSGGESDLRFVNVSELSDPASAASIALRAALVGKVTPEQFGAVGNGTTDDTAAIQAAHDWLEANGGGVLTFGNKTYRLDSAPRHDRGGNSIIAFGQYPNGAGPTVVWEGVTPQENYQATTGGGTVLRCTRTTDTYSGTYGPPSVIGGQTRENTNPANLDPFSYMSITLRNIAVRVPNNPAVAAIDLRYVGRAEIDGTIAIADTPDLSSSPPTHLYAFALRMPGRNNWNKSLIRSGGAYGFYCGLVPEEHLTVDYWSQKWCVIGTGIQGAGSNHAWTAQKISSEWCTHHIAGYSVTAGVAAIPNPVFLSVDLFDIEDSPVAGMYTGSGGWFETSYHVNDSANMLRGLLNYSRQKDGVGNLGALLRSGGTGLAVRDLVSPRASIGKQVVVDLLATPMAKVGDWRVSQNTAAWFAAVAYNNAAAQGDYVSFLVELEEGDYQLDLFAMKDSYCGIVTLKLDGATFTTADLYAASSTTTRVSFGVTVPGGARQLTLAMDTKNASASGYVGQVSRLTFTRTA